jgi:hypothetical protein
MGNRSDLLKFLAEKGITPKQALEILEAETVPMRKKEKAVIGSYEKRSKGHVRET